MIRFAHLVNPVFLPESHELNRAQRITFESMRQAKAFSQNIADVELLSVQYPEDQQVVPDYFKKLPDLTTSIIEAGGLPKAKKFPLIAEMMKLLYENTDADYLIYTNTDITLVPHFYSAIAQLITTHQYDAISINRRRIAFDFNSIEELPLIMAQMGKLHPGYDCFVFHRSLFPKFIFSNICIGTGYTSVAFIHNVIAFAEKPFITDKLHLTVHLGLEVMPPLEQTVYRFTRDDYRSNIYPLLKPFLSLKKFPYALLPFHKRFIKWALNPNFSVAVMLELEGKKLFRKYKALIDECRFWLLDKL